MVMITSLMKQHNVFISAFYPVLVHLPCKIRTVIICTVCGVLPIPGRIIVTSMCLDCACKTNRSTGLLAYLTSHHYYLWSPLEKTVILPIAILGLTYIDMIVYMFIPLIIYICYTVYILNKHNVDSIDNIVNSNKYAWVDVLLLTGLLVYTGVFEYIKVPGNIKLPTLLIISFIFLCYMVMKYKPAMQRLLYSIPIKSVTIITSLLIIGTYIKQHIQDVEPYVKNVDIWIVCLTSFIISFLLGSSGKFAGLCVLTTMLYGQQWFVLLFMVDFAGYLLSPFHKCLPIAIENFKTPVKTMVQSLIPLCMILLLYGVLCTLV